MTSSLATKPESKPAEASTAAAPVTKATKAPVKAAAPAPVKTKAAAKKAAPKASKPVPAAAKKAPVKAVANKAPAPAPVPAKTAKAAEAKVEKVKKAKLVRDSFTIPKAEYAVLAVLKLRAGKLGHAAKKSELLRAGIKVLAGLGDSALAIALKNVPAVKTGRPKAD